MTRCHGSRRTPRALGHFKEATRFVGSPPNEAPLPAPGDQGPYTAHSPCGVVYAFGLLVGVGLLARHRVELLRDMLLVAVLAVVGVVVLSQLIDRRWPEFAFFDLQQTRFTFPSFFVATSAALQAAASPRLTAPMRRIGWTFILVATGAAVSAVLIHRLVSDYLPPLRGYASLRRLTKHDSL